MNFLTASVLALTLVVPAFAGEGYSYDPAAVNGPANWPTLTAFANNECGGSKQSGIDIPTGLCDEKDANYIFEVRKIGGA